MSLTTQSEQAPEAVSTAAEVPRILLVAPSLRIMGGQAVMAARLVQDMRNDGVAIDHLPINPKPPWPLHYAERVKYLRTLVVSFFYVLSLLRKVPQYDVIHIFSASYLSFIISQSPAILIARLFGKPIILNYRSGECEDHLRKWGRSIFWLLRMCTIVVQSRYLADTFAKFGFETHVIANNVDLKSLPFRERTPIPTTAKILVPRALEALYNVGCAIRAFARVQQTYPDIQLTILGDGHQRKILQTYVQDQQIQNVTFTGRVNRESIASYYASHDVFLNSSSIDNMPVSILEAFACGLPVVSTAAGGIPYIVTDGETGYLAPIDDDAALAAHIKQIIQQPDDAASVVERAHEEVQRYDWSAVSESWYSLYRQITNQPSAKAEVNPTI